MTRTKKASQQEQTPISCNFSTPLPNEEQAELAHTIRIIVKQEIQAQQVVLQETVRCFWEITNERLEKLSGQASDITKTLEFTK